MLFKKIFPSKDSPSSGSRTVNSVTVSTFLRKNRWMILICVLSLFLLFSFFGTQEKQTEKSEKSSVLHSYTETLRSELERTLTKMSGVGKCMVFITFSDGGETVYACDEDLSQSEGKTDSDRKYVLISSRSDGLVLKVYTPSILGVAVICEGGDSSRVKNDVTELLSRTLGLTSDRIAVKKMNS